MNKSINNNNSYVYESSNLRNLRDDDTINPSYNRVYENIDYNLSTNRLEESLSDAKDGEKTVFKNLINFLIYLKDPWKIINNCPDEVINGLYVMNDINYKYANTFDYLNESRKNQFIELIIDYFKYVYENLKENMVKYKCLIVKNDPPLSISSQYKLQTNTGNQYSKKIEILYKFSLVIWSLADKSFDFCVKFHDLKGIRILFKYLNDTLLVNHLVKQLKVISQSRNNITILGIGSTRLNEAYVKLGLTFKSIIGSCHDLSKHEHVFKKEWSDLNAFNSLVKLSQIFSEFPEYNITILAHFALVNLYRKSPYADDASSASRDLHLQLPQLQAIVQEVVNLLSICSKTMSNNENLNRKLFKLNTFSDIQTEIATVCDRDTVWRITELLNFLTTVASYDEKLKYELFERHQVKLSLKLILINGNLIEKEYALKLLWKLALDLRVSNSIKNDINLYSFVIGLSLNKNISNKNILKYSKLILFLLGDEISFVTYVPNQDRYDNCENQKYSSNDIGRVRISDHKMRF